MLALLQRVNFAKVVVDGKVTGQIDKGILAFIGLEKVIMRPNVKECSTRS